MKKEVIGKQTLYCGNSLEIMDLLTDKSYGLVLTDPPYMINTKSDGTGKRPLGRLYERRRILCRVDWQGAKKTQRRRGTNVVLELAECRHVYQGVVPFGLADGKFGGLEQKILGNKYARVPTCLRNGGVVHASGL